LDAMDCIQVRVTCGVWRVTCDVCQCLPALRLLDVSNNRCGSPLNPYCTITESRLQ
jgi:hypothetical protein